jgi:hypothetical protein
MDFLGAGWSLIPAVRERLLKGPWPLRQKGVLEWDNTVSI